jgi:hypothetical protein
MGSEFFFTTADAFEKLKGSQIQEIFRHRHIVIPGQPQEEFQFNRRGLSMLGSLTAPREIQG